MSEFEILYRFTIVPIVCGVALLASIGWFIYSTNKTLNKYEDYKKDK